jgi:hypothetical protein
VDDEVVERRTGIAAQRCENPGERFARDPARVQLVEERLARDEQRDARDEEEENDSGDDNGGAAARGEKIARRPAQKAKSSEIVLIRCDD